MLLHLTADVARRKKRVSLYYSLTGKLSTSAQLHTFEDEGDVSGCDGDFLLGGTPLTTVNGVSQFQPEWICWEPGWSGFVSHQMTLLQICRISHLSVCHDV